MNSIKMSSNTVYNIKKNRKFTIIAVLVFLISFFKVQAQVTNNLKVAFKVKPNAFHLIHKGKVPSILIDKKDAQVVEIVANALASDIEKVSGVKPEVISNIEESSDYIIIAGTLGNSVIIDKLIKSKKIDVDVIQNRWESYTITTVDSPILGIKRALVVIGSDRRGTAYGMFEISKMIGVSPWVWWADVTPESRESLYILSGTKVEMGPSVKYRGIFLNDEDWGLQPWAAKKIDTDIKDLGPKSYAKIFELMLRLRANTIWPAMHDSTKPFWFYKDNPKVADQYAIVISSTHCDMMQRSNTYEWQVNYENEYKHKPGVFQYDVNKREVFEYWNDRVKESANYESIFTIGMRGIRDGSIQGPKTIRDKIFLMDTIISDQRKMLNNAIGSVNDIPQIFCPYKEVLKLYNAGLKVPEDVTLVWADDNFGYIRKLSDPEEQKRKGGSGVYYHLSYMGGPHGYLWLSSNSPSLISFEMTKAYQFKASRFWIANVGDIKPAEMETQFFLDMAWDVEKWTPENAEEYIYYWASQIFGEDLAFEIAAIKKEFYKLLQSGKPEQMGLIVYSNETIDKRLTISEYLIKKVDELKVKIPIRLQNSFYELIEYPVTSAALMNQKVLNARLSLKVKKSNPKKALSYSKKALQAFYDIQSLANKYSTEIENGKWDGMITAFPRNQEIFGMPEVANMEIVSDTLKNKVYDSRYLDDHLVFESGVKPGAISITANNYKRKKENEQESIIIPKGLGLDGNGITRYPFKGASYKKEDLDRAPYVEYDVMIESGKFNMSLKCLPTYAIHKGRGLVMGISVNGSVVQFKNVNHARKDLKWKTNIMRGYSEAQISFEIKESGKSTVRIYFMDTGLVLNRIDIDKHETF